MKKVLILFCLLCLAVCSTGCSSEPRNCSIYNLEQYAKNEEDLLVLHEITGVVLGYAEYDDKYVVKINRKLWHQTNSEQRMLIRCSAENVGYKKGLKGVVLDPNTNEILN